MHLLKIDPEIVYQAFSDPIRIRIVRLLADSNEEMCLCEFVDSLVEPQYKLSKHLKCLRQAGLLSSSKEGRWVYHRLVANSSYIKFLFQSVKALPDSDKVFAEDIKRFKKRLKLRTEGRCEIGIQTPQLSEGRISTSRNTAGKNELSP